MKWFFFLLFLIVYGLSGLILPWWGLAIPAFIGGIFLTGSVRSFLVGFLLGFCLWMMWAVVQDISMAGRISMRVSQILEFSHPLKVVLLTGAIGGLVSGFSSLTGYFFGESINLFAKFSD